MGRTTGLSNAIPEPYRGNIQRLSERIYKETGTQSSSNLNLTAQEVDIVVQDINRAMEEVDANLKDAAWREAYTALATLKGVVQNFSASLSMRRASLGQYDAVWPGSRWKGT